MKRLVPGSVALVFALVGVSTTAFADEKWTPNTHRSVVGLDVGLWSATTSGTTLPLVLFGQYALEETPLVLGTRLPMVASIDGPDDATRFSMGNLDLSAAYADRDDSTYWWVGGGLNAPLATLMNDSSSIANGLAVAAAAAYDADLWVTDALPIYLSAGFLWGITKGVAFKMTTRPIVMIPIVDRDDAEFVWLNRPGVEFRHRPTGLGGGLDVPITWWATEPEPLGGAHAALYPYASYTGERVFASLGLLMALNEPFGFAFDRGRVATIKTAVGAAF